MHVYSEEDDFDVKVEIIKQPKNRFLIKQIN